MALGKADVQINAIAVVAAVENFSVSGEVGEHAAVGDAGFDVEIGERAAEGVAGGLMQTIEADARAGADRNRVRIAVEHRQERTAIAEAIDLV